MADRHYLIAGQKLIAPPLPPALYLVSTPIGNLKDISLRALETLAVADLIFCEDTRTSAKLLNHYGISSKRAALHEHNESAQAQHIVDDVKGGKVICLISDAGTPLLSDPGFPLVRLATQNEIDVFAIPGASALLSALTVSGLPTDSFGFYGFLPPKQKARLDRLSALKNLRNTLVFYESPKRTAAALKAIAEALGETRQVVVARELTKRFETLYRGTASELADQFAEMEVKGEVVLVVEGAKEQVLDDDVWQEALKKALEEAPLRSAVDEIAQSFGLNRKKVYQTALSLKK